MCEVRKEHVEGEVVNQVRGEIVQGAILAGDKSVGAKGEVDLSGAEGRQFGLEEGVGSGEAVPGTGARETIEDDIGGSVYARLSEREDVWVWCVGVERKAKEQEEDNAAEEDVQSSTWGRGERSRWWATRDRYAKTSICGYETWEDHRTEEDQEGFDAIHGLDGECGGATALTYPRRSLLSPC